MDKIIDKAKKIREELDRLPEFQEYYRLKKLVEADEELKTLKKELARLESLKLYEEKKNLQQIYDSHPLITNFEQSREEIRNILEMVKNILSD